jgi:hypothetical protein
LPLTFPLTFIGEVGKTLPIHHQVTRKNERGGFGDGPAMESAQSQYTFAEQEKRRAERKRLSIPATLHPALSKRVKTVLKDLSRTGFSATMPSPIIVDTVCSLTIPDRDPMSARVVWWRAGLVGCAFENPIGAVAYDVILERWDTDTITRTAKRDVATQSRRSSR